MQVPSNLDAIVIGGGVSGLSTAATVSKAGKRVLVLEQNTYLGGGASTYQINRVDFDIGTYFVGQVLPEMWTCVSQITEGQVTFVPFDDVQDRVYVGTENRISVLEDHRVYYL